MADVTAILSAFRVELITAGLVRRPSEATADGPPLIGATPWRRPPMHTEPSEVPAPGEREGVENDAGLVLSLLHDTDLTPRDNYDAALGRVAILSVRYRSNSSDELRRAVALDAAIVNRLIRPATNYGYGFTLAEATPAALWVQAAGVFAGFGLVSRSRAAGDDHVAKYAVAAAR